MGQRLLKGQDKWDLVDGIFTMHFQLFSFRQEIVVAFETFASIVRLT